MNSNELEHQLSEYCQNVRNLWLKEVPAILVLAGLVVFGLMYAVVKFSIHQPFNSDWQIVAIVMALGFSIPPIMMNYPERPSEKSIEHDKVLNQIAQLATNRKQSN